MYKPYIVTLQFLVPQQAQMMIVTDDPDKGAEGALETLPADYVNVKVTAVEEYKQTKETLN